MGSRIYIGRVSKNKYEDINSLSIKELLGYFNVVRDEISPTKFLDELYCFGSRFNSDIIPPKHINDFFKKPRVKKFFSECEISILDKSFLEDIINQYKTKIIDKYDDLTTPFFGVKNNILDRDNPSDFIKSMKLGSKINSDYDISFDFNKITQEEQNKIFKMLFDMKEMRTKWKCLDMFKLESGDEVTTSGNYEHGIFELVRIYKTFDWSNDLLVWYCW